jgi:3-phenylpropionate/trans-cinnamate dioxygenase ferredoxin reductase subunit
MRHFDALIVGAGHAGAQAAICLRQLEFAGSIGLLGEEPDPPYERPPLSKGYLAGNRAFDSMLLRPLAYWAAKAITLLPCRRAVAVDANQHVVATAEADWISYGTLIWAAGGHARKLTCRGHDLEGVHTIRTRADIDRMRAELPDMRHAVVIGGGYIGLEVASVLTKLGKAVTVVEMQDRVLARVAGVDLSRFYEAEHRQQGVDIFLNCEVACIEAAEGRAKGVRLADGRVLPAEMVVVGIGIVPNVEPLRAAGAPGVNGVDVDAFCRTPLPDVYAIGDCAAHVNRFAGGARLRLESVQNAADQAMAVAKSIMGVPMAYEAIPWFWSNQYDLQLQTIGLSLGHGSTVLRGDPEGRSFSVVYLREGRVIALDCVNAPRDYAQGKALVLNGTVVDPLVLADAQVPLKASLLRHNA